MQMESLATQLVEYSHGDVLLEAYVAYDSKKTNNGLLPSVIVCHAFGGRGEFECKKADDLAQMGYVGFAADLYGKGKTGGNPEESRKLMTPLKEDRKLLIDRLGKVLETLKTLPFVDKNKIAAIGFCFGGLCVLDMARADFGLKGVVSFHGTFIPPEHPLPDIIKTKVLVCHGDADFHIPPETIRNLEKEMRDKKADWQLHIYGGAYHGFTHTHANDVARGVKYDEKANRRSWASMKELLEECFT